MYKKDQIRTFILNAKDGFTFSGPWLAEKLAVTHKDVANVTLTLTRAACLSRTKSENKAYLYSVDQNITALYFAKHPIGVTRPYSNPDKLPARVNVPSRKKNRSPFIIALDAEIAELQCKIKRLNALRKEFA